MASFTKWIMKFWKLWIGSKVIPVFTGESGQKYWLAIGEWMRGFIFTQMLQGIR
jgi:hypothetical protein